MKIVHLIYSFTVGGAETMLVDIVNEQSKSNEISVIIVNSLYSDTLINKFSNNVKIHLLKRKPGSRNPITIFRLNLLIFRLSPKIIHCHNASLYSLLLPKFRKTMCYTTHSMEINNKCIINYHKVFAISKSVMNVLKSRYLNPILVYNGIQVELIKQKTSFTKNQVFRIVVVGRLLHESKGQDLVIDSIGKIISEKNINIQIDIIGEGPSKEFLTNLVDKYDISKYVNFLGLQDRTYIYDNLKEYDLLIQASRHEGFGLTVVEAMAAKLPVLVSNIDGPIEIINNGEFGFYFMNGDVKSLENSIIKIIEMPIQEKIKITNLAYNYVLKNFDIKQTALNYLKYY